MKYFFNVTTYSVFYSNVVKFNYTVSTDVSILSFIIRLFSISTILKKKNLLKTDYTRIQIFTEIKTKICIKF